MQHVLLSFIDNRAVERIQKLHDFHDILASHESSPFMKDDPFLLMHSIKSIKDSKLMVFKSNKQVECILLPKACANIRTSIAMSTVLVHYDLRNKSMTKLLHIPAVDTVTPWTGIFF